MSSTLFNIKTIRIVLTVMFVNMSFSGDYFNIRDVQVNILVTFSLPNCSWNLGEFFVRRSCVYN